MRVFMKKKVEFNRQVTQVKSLEDIAEMSDIKQAEKPQAIERENNNPDEINVADEIQSIPLRLENLTKTFIDKKGNVTRAVDDLTITIPAGKLIGLLGPSGCGKSTTLYMISGLHKPTDGRIYFGEEDVTDFAPETRGIGLVFQNYALYPHMTVRQNIMFPLENMKIPKEQALEMAQQMAELVQIGDLLDRKPNQLSGGQQQRVAIARALVKKPKVLLLDEPLSNLDARLRLQMREEIKRIQRETGITTVFVTHDQEEAMSISDEIFVMDKGVLQQNDHPQLVYSNPKNLFVAKFLGSPQINVLSGKVEKKTLKLENGTVLEKDFDAPDGIVSIGIRPEHLVVSEGGKIPTKVKMVEHIGRDNMIISELENGQPIRGIVDGDFGIFDKTEVSFNYKKIYVFDEAGKRIH